MALYIERDWVQALNWALLSQMEEMAGRYNAFEVSKRTALVLFQKPDERDSDIVLAR